MEKLHFCIGLPRSGSTLLMNILQQNPLIFTSASSPTPYLVGSTRDISRNVSEFIAMTQEKREDCLENFLKMGFKGWYESLTDKPVVISKSRPWDQELLTIFKLYNNPKIIVNIRDIRDIICSYEKLLCKYPMWTIFSSASPQSTLTREKRIELFCTGSESNLGRPLALLPIIVEWMQKRPECFFLIRIEDFNKDPKGCFKALYQWLDLPYYDHDLNNIEQSEQYEHDTIYRALVSHKTERTFRPLDQTHKTMLTLEENYSIIHNNQWFYQTFYPEIYNEYVASVRTNS